MATILQFQPRPGKPAEGNLGQVLSILPRLRRPAPPPAPTFDVARLFAAAVDIEDKDPEMAITIYGQVLALAPFHADAFVNRGRLHHEAGRLLEAEANYQLALHTNAKHPLALFNLAVVLEDQKRLQDAVAAYRCAVEADPKHADAWYNLGRLYETMGQQMDAIRCMTRYRQLNRRPA